MLTRTPTLLIAALALLSAGFLPAAADAKTKVRKPVPRLSGDTIVKPNQPFTLYASGYPKRTYLGVFIHPEKTDGFNVGSSVSATFSTDDNGRATIQLVFPEYFYNCAQGCAKTPWLYGNIAAVDISSLSQKKPATARHKAFVNGSIPTL